MELTEFGIEQNESVFKNILSFVRKIIGTNFQGFLGNHPVSLNLTNINWLLEKDYYVVEKSDGVRALFLCFNGVVYLYDRKNKIYKTSYSLKDQNVYLFDGEMYFEKKVAQFAIFDTLIYKNSNIINEDFKIRLTYACRFFYKLKDIILYDKKQNYFEITVKRMQRSYNFKVILDNIKKLNHDNDGLIFTPIKTPYEIGSRTTILKWKPPFLNTVDFLINKTRIPVYYKLQCFSDRKISTFAYFYDERTDLDNKIGEFRFDTRKEVLDITDMSISYGGWSLYKVRTDKTEPNGIRTVFNLLSSIRENLSEETILSFKDKMEENYLRRNK